MPLMDNTHEIPIKEELFLDRLWRALDEIESVEVKGANVLLRFASHDPGIAAANKPKGAPHVTYTEAGFKLRLNITY